MGAIKYGIFFFLLSKILAVNCLQKNPTDSVQFNGQNAGAHNSWPGQPVHQQMTNYYNSINPNPPQNRYLNNNDNQQHINYQQQSPKSQPYNEPQHFTTPPHFTAPQHQTAPQHFTAPQQLTPQIQNYLPPIQPPTNHQIQQVNTFQPPLTGTPQIVQANPMLQHQSQPIPIGQFNSEPVHQQSINMQYPKLNPNENTKFNQPVINQKNENQQSQVPQSYNLQSSTQSGQGEPQSFGTTEPLPPKEDQKQLSMSLNHPLPEEIPDFGELPDSGELPDFGQVINNAKNNENKPVQVDSTIVPQSTQQTLLSSKPEIPSNQFLPPTSLLPSQNQLHSSLKPSDKDSSTTDKNNMENKNDAPFISKAEFPTNIFIPPTENELHLSQSPPSIIPPTSNKLQLSQMPLQSSTKPLHNGSNKNNMDIEDDEPFNSQSDFPNDTSSLTVELPPPTKNQLNLPQSSNSIPPITDTIQLSQIPLRSSSKPLDSGSSTSNKNNMEIEDVGLFNPQSDLPDNIIFTPKSPLPSQNQLNLPLSSSSNPPIPNQLRLSQIALQSPSELLDKGPLIPGKYNMDIEDDAFLGPKLPQSTQNQFNLPQSSSSELLDKGPSTPNKNNMEIEDGEPFNNSQSDVPNNILLNPKLPPPTQNQLNFPQSPSLNPPISNQLPLSQIPLESSTELLDKGPAMPNINSMQDKKDGVSLNSIPGFLDDKSEPLISNVVQNENILIDNSQTDMQTFLNPENNDSMNPLNNVSENQDYSKLESNNIPPQEPEAMIIYPQPNDFKKDIILNDDTQALPNASNDFPFSTNVVDTQQNTKFEEAMSELPVFPFNEYNKERNALHSLENIVFDEPLEEGLSKYDESYIVDTENPENAKEDNSKIVVFANPNDVHIQQISPEQSPTSDNSYPNNNYLLNTPSTDIPWYKPSFPNTVDYVQQSDSNANNQLLSSLLNFNQNPMYPPTNNYYNQQDPYSAFGQNQMISKTQLPSLSLNANQRSSKNNSGYMYKKVDLKNPSPNISNSWLLLNKDYTKNPNQNNAYTNTFGTPSMSYQNNIQGILNSSSNDMFVQNMISVISNSLQAPLAGTKAIFDVTRANFPRAPVSHIIRLTHAIVRSVMLNLRQTLNTVMNTLYGRRSKRDYNPSEALHKLPGALINKYSQQSTTAPTASNMNMPYYNQPDATGQPPMADFSASQPMLQQQQTYYDGVTGMNNYGPQYSNNNNNRVAPQPANTQNYVLNSLVDAITTAIRSNVPDPYSIDTPEVKEYTQQVIVIVEIVYKNQIDNIIYGHPPTMNT